MNTQDTKYHEVFSPQDFPSCALVPLVETGSQTDPLPSSERSALRSTLSYNESRRVH